MIRGELRQSYYAGGNRLRYQRYCILCWILDGSEIPILQTTEGITVQVVWF